MKKPATKSAEKTTDVVDSFITGLVLASIGYALYGFLHFGELPPTEPQPKDQHKHHGLLAFLFLADWAGGTQQNNAAQH